MADFDQLKNTLLGFSMFQGGNSTGSTSRGGGTHVDSLISGMIMMQMLEYVNKYIPIVASYVKKEIEERCKRRVMENLVDTDDTPSCSISFHYLIDTTDDTTESIVSYLCSKDETKFLRYSKDFKPCNLNKEGFLVNYKDLRCKIKIIEYSDEGALEKFVFDLFSKKMTLTQLHKWINEIKDEYETEKKNQLGQKRYFFQEIPSPPPKEMGGGYRWGSSLPNLQFSMTEFTTNKSLSNVYGDEIKQIKKRVDLFMNNPEWYEKRGIPRTLGILLHGAPGTGKTSVIKAIAKDTNKHIISFSLASYTTKEQLENLFRTETLSTLVNGQTTLYKIPLTQRLYVIEDIDCLTEIVKQRREEALAPNVEQPKRDLVQPMGNFASYEPKQIPKDGEGVAIDLSFILNLLDGIVEVPQRILIMTTNHPETLDKALIRPGRIDLNIQFKNMEARYIKIIFEEFYETPVNLDFQPFGAKFTPAQIIQALSLNIHDPQHAYDFLKDACMLPQVGKFTLNEFPSKEKDEYSGTMSDSELPKGPPEITEILFK